MSTSKNLTVEEAAKEVVAALKAQGKAREEIHAIFNGLFFGEAWESYELYRHIELSFRAPAPAPEAAQPQPRVCEFCARQARKLELRDVGGHGPKMLVCADGKGCDENGI